MLVDSPGVAYILVMYTAWDVYEYCTRGFWRSAREKPSQLEFRGVEQV